jgi:hypothetical protein
VSARNGCRSDSLFLPKRLFSDAFSSRRSPTSLSLAHRCASRTPTASFLDTSSNRVPHPDRQPFPRPATATTTDRAAGLLPPPHRYGTVSVPLRILSHLPLYAPLYAPLSLSFDSFLSLDSYRKSRRESDALARLIFSSSFDSTYIQNQPLLQSLV